MAAFPVPDDQAGLGPAGKLLLQWGPDFITWVGDEKISVSERLNNLIKLIDLNPECKVNGGDLLWDRIVDQVFVSWSIPSAGVLSPEEEAFRRALRHDGVYITTFEGMKRVLPADVRLPTTEDEITKLLEKHRLFIALGHMKQALDAHGRGDWAAANSQIRTFFNAFLDEIAERLDPSAAALASGQGRRAKLAAAGFLSRDLNEWDDNGLGFVRG